MKQLLSAIFLFACFHGFSQSKWNNKDMSKLEDADIYLEITDYRTALEHYNDLYKKHPGEKELDYKIGLCLFNLGRNDESFYSFEKSAMDGNLNARFYLGLYYHINEKFDEAIDQFMRIKTEEGRKDFDLQQIDKMIEVCERARKMMDNPEDIMVYNLGDEINTEFDDYGPLIQSDEGMMAFTSRRAGSTGGKLDPYGEYLEDIYISTKTENIWSNVVNAGPPLNSETHDAAVGLSADGNSMIIYRTNKELTAGDLYLSTKSENKWSKPEKLHEAINSEYQEASASLTDDQRVIYFSSNRPGGLGGKDIYRVVRITDDIWSLPLNLGPTINTEYDEDAPFIHPADEKLYFSSKGHKTMGGYDIFVSSLNEDYWSMPKNLGYPANTVGDDIFFVLAKDGKRGYYSSERDDGYGGHDIYAVSFENDLERLRVIKGNISDENGNALSASISLVSIEGEPFGNYSTNSKTGNYVIILPPDQEFSMNIEADGFKAEQDELHYIGGTNVKEKVKNYTLVKSLEQ